MGLNMLSNRLDWNRVERLVSAKVDQSHQKSISKTKKILSKWPRKEVVDFVQSNDSSQLMSTRHTGNRFPRHFKNIPRVITKGIGDVVESNDSKQLMSTRHTGSRFARHLENIPRDDPQHHQGREVQRHTS